MRLIDLVYHSILGSGAFQDLYREKYRRKKKKRFVVLTRTIAFEKDGTDATPYMGYLALSETASS